MTDEGLLLEYRKSGDQDLFAELVRRYERKLYTFLMRRFNDGSVAEDAFQSAFLQVHMKCDRFQQGRRFEPWLYTIAFNAAITIIRRNRRHYSVSLYAPFCEADDRRGQLLDMLVSGADSPEDRLERLERESQCHEAVMRLPEKIRDAVDLVFLQGLKYREAAEALAIPIGTLKSRIHDAVVKLRAAYDEGRRPPGRKWHSASAAGTAH
jgi:RNA polymerase sigma-70 factor (ECF subfamily)